MSDPVDIIGRICNDGEGSELSRIAEALGFDEGYEARIRDKALEEAASICDDLSKLYTEPVGFDEGYSMASKRAASEIRNLKSRQAAQADGEDKP